MITPGNLDNALVEMTANELREAFERGEIRSAWDADKTARAAICAYLNAAAASDKAFVSSMPLWHQEADPTPVFILKLEKPQ